MILDLYAGAGGWDVAARSLGLPSPVGLEIEHDPCATAVAAGGRRIRCDVATYPTAPFSDRVTGLVGSPPCQAWSAAGLRGGEHDRDRVRELVDMIAEGDRSADRWVRDLRPEWVCLEQVPAVLGLWDCGTALIHVLIDPRPAPLCRAGALPARRSEGPADARGLAPHPVSGVAGCGALTRPRSRIAADRPAAHFPRAAGPATRPGARGVSYRPGRVALPTTTTTVVLPGVPT